MAIPELAALHGLEQRDVDAALGFVARRVRGRPHVQRAGDPWPRIGRVFLAAVHEKNMVKITTKTTGYLRSLVVDTSPLGHTQR